MSQEKHAPLIIVGGGPAGMTAAIYAVRAGIDALLIERGVPGGQLFITDRIENYPGFPEGISGPDLADRMRDQASRLGAKILQDEVAAITRNGDLKRLRLGSGDELTCDALIIATGCRPRNLGVPGEKELWGRGVSYCATCDGNFFRGQKVAVVGGGDSAVQEATLLSHLAKEVVIIHRRDQFRAQDVLSRCAQGQENVKVLWNTVVEKIEGKQAVEALVLKDLPSGQLSRLELDGVFIYVGIIPLTDLVKDLVELTDDGYLRAGEDTRTSGPGILAAGDARKKPTRQIATAVADGANAVNAVELYFIEKGLSCKYA